MELAWGEQKHWLIPLVDGEPSSDKEKIITLYPIVDGTMQLNPTKGDKKEAIVEGGDVEAVRYSKNKNQVQFEMRKGLDNGENRKELLEHNDGIVPGEYQYLCQPENPKVEGLKIDRCIVSIEDTYNAADGARWRFTLDALKPKFGNQVKSEIIQDPTAAIEAKS